jgi:hypothetical protein
MTGTLHEHQHTFLIITRSITLGMKNVSHMFLEKIKTHFMFNRFPSLTWEFFLVGEDPHGDHGLGS